MIAEQHHRALASALGASLGHIAEGRGSVEAAGFDIGEQADRLEEAVIVAAADERWGDVLVGLLALAHLDPGVYFGAWAEYAAACVAAVTGAANSSGAPIPPGFAGRIWRSAHGLAIEQSTGSIRVTLPVSMGKNETVVLPLERVEVRHG